MLKIVLWLSQPPSDLACAESLQAMNHLYTMLWSTVQAVEKHMPNADLQSLRQLSRYKLSLRMNYSVLI